MKSLTRNYKKKHLQGLFSKVNEATAAGLFTQRLDSTRNFNYTNHAHPRKLLENTVEFNEQRNF